MQTCQLAIIHHMAGIAEQQQQQGTVAQGAAHQLASSRTAALYGRRADRCAAIFWTCIRVRVELQIMSAPVNSSYVQTADYIV